MRLWDREDPAAHEPLDDRNERELLCQAFACMEPALTLDERILQMAQQPHTPRKASWTHRMPARVAAAAALTAALVGSGAYAATQTDFFSTAFGDKGQSNVEAHEVTDEVTGSTWTAPSCTWVEADPAVVERLVAPYVQEVGETLELNGYTLQVQDFAIDANGLGIASYTLANPQGVGDQDAGYGQVYMGSDAAVGDVFVLGADGQMYDDRSVRDNDLSTDTELHGVLYFVAGDVETAGDTLQWGLIDPQTWEIGEANTTASVAIDERMPARTLTASDGSTASLSALGVVLAGEGGMERWDAVQSVALRFADGTDYVLKGDDVYNAVVALMRTDSSTAYLFNRLVDTDAVESIAVELNGGEELVFEG